MRGLTFLGWFSMLGSAAALRAYTVLCWCALVALMVWVVMQWWVPAPVVAPALSRVPSAQYRMDQSAEARLLGVEQAGAATPPSVKVVGLFANAEGRGAAVLSVDGQPAVSRQVGQEVSNGWVLSAVSARQVVLERQGLRHSVDLPIPGADPAMLVRVPAAR